MTRRRSVSDENGTLAARIATTMTIIATTNEIPSTHHRRLIATATLKRAQPVPPTRGRWDCHNYQMLERPADCRRGDDALARGAWTEAREAFEKALARRESPEALEGLGTAAWWLDLADLVFESRERAYRLVHRARRQGGASRVAVWIAWDCWAFRGETAVANGWLQRARRLLDGEPPLC